MSSNRLKILSAALLVALGFWVWHWIAGWGLVTVIAQDQTFDSIRRSIERQGGVRIISNVPGDTKISMFVERVPAVVAVDALASHVDARWAAMFAVGASRVELTGAINSLKSGDRNSGFLTFRTPGRRMMAMDVAPDIRRVRWNVSSMEENSLHAYLDQMVQKTGAAVIVSEGWNPVVPKPPRSNETSEAIRDLIKSVGGKTEEFFAITISDRDGRAPWDDAGRAPNRAGSGNASTPRQSAPPTAPGGATGAGRTRSGNPDWAQERIVAQIASLPPEQREQAMAEIEDWRAFRERVQSLPEDQRRAAFEERMSNPAVQERMLEREVRRDSMRGPERRLQRYKNYIERKKERLNGQ